MRLWVTSPYRNGDVAYAVGQVLDVADTEGELLLRDSPGSFSAEEPTVTDVAAVDRRARGGRVRDE